MPANTYGRQVVIPLTNKSGGQVIAGDVVVVDTSNNDAFTTSTAGAVTGGVGIAQATIASNATGPVLLSGYAALVNTSASVTRGNFGKTHTVAKQAVDAGASRTVGTFCQFLTGGTTPDARVYPPDLSASSGSVATDAIWDAAGDLVQGTGADTAAKLPAGSAGQMLKSAGAAAANLWAYPPNYQYDYAEITSSVNVTATTEATAAGIITGAAVSYNGSQVVMVECFIPFMRATLAAGENLHLWLYDGSSSIGRLASVSSDGGVNLIWPIYVARKLTPSNASHTYSIRSSVSSGTGVISCGAGGSGNVMPAYMRVVAV